MKILICKLRTIIFRLGCFFKFKLLLLSGKHLQFKSNQEALFAQHGFDRDKALTRLNVACEKVLSKSFNESDGMMSEHLVLFAAISLQKEVHSILEIGTFDGRSAAIISELFPNAKITTIDLAQSDSDFENSYARNNKVEQFIQKRKSFLSWSKNIKFVEKNSLLLTNNTSKEFDLIWIDGAHGYPVVAIDLLNAYKLAKKDGYILIDDIWVNSVKSDPMYCSVGGYQTLEAMKNSTLIKNYYLFKKRIDARYNVKGFNQKYVGFIKL